MKRINKPINTFTENDIITLIKSFNPYGDSGYKWIKSIINSFLHWLTDEKNIDCNNQIRYIDALKSIDLINSESIGKFYFRNFKDLQVELDMYIKNICQAENAHESTYDTCKAIIYLSWVGLDIGEISDFLKKDINYLKGTISYKNRKRVVEDNLLEFLEEYSKADLYIRNGTKEHIKFSYKPSIYLVRTARSDHLKITAIKCLISKLNSKDEDWPKRYQLKKIRQSGVFSRAYKKQLEMGPAPKYNIGTGNSLSEKEKEHFETLFEIEYEWKKAKDILIQYESYINYFYE